MRTVVVLKRGPQLYQDTLKDGQGCQATCNLLRLAHLLELILSLCPVMQLLLGQACVLDHYIKYLGVNLSRQIEHQRCCLAIGERAGEGLVLLTLFHSMLNGDLLC